MSTKPIFGHLDGFNTREEQLSSCKEKRALFFQANDVAEYKNLSVFISIVSSESLPSFDTCWCLLSLMTGLKLAVPIGPVSGSIILQLLVWQAKPRLKNAKLHPL